MRITQSPRRKTSQHDRALLRGSLLQIGSFSLLPSSVRFAGVSVSYATTVLAAVATRLLRDRTGIALGPVHEEERSVSPTAPARLRWPDSDRIHTTEHRSYMN